MKRLVSIILVLMLIISTLQINTFATESNEYKVWVAPSTTKVLKEEKIPLVLQTAMSISMAGNEYETGQVIITAGEIPINDVKIQVTELACGEDKISQNQISLFVQHYTHVTEPTSGYLKAGWYPDALIPLDNYISKHGKLSVAVRENQGITVKVKTEKNTVPGIYTGKVTITVDGDVAEIPIKVKVWDFSLTDECHSLSSYGYWGNWMLLAGHPGIEENSPEYWKLLGNYWDYLLDYRISPHPNFPIPAPRKVAGKHRQLCERSGKICEGSQVIGLFHSLPDL